MERKTKLFERSTIIVTMRYYDCNSYILEHGLMTLCHKIRRLMDFFRLARRHTLNDIALLYKMHPYLRAAKCKGNKNYIQQSQLALLYFCTSSYVVTEFQITTTRVCFFFSVLGHLMYMYVHKNSMERPAILMHNK